MSIVSLVGLGQRSAVDAIKAAVLGQGKVKWDVVGWDLRRRAALEVGSRSEQSASDGSSAPLITNRTSRSPKFPMAENSGFARTTSATFFYSLCNPVHFPPTRKSNYGDNPSCAGIFVILGCRHLQFRPRVREHQQLRCRLCVSACTSYLLPPSSSVQ